MLLDRNEKKNKASFKKAILKNFKEMYDPTNDEIEMNISKLYLPKYIKLYKAIYQEIEETLDEMSDFNFPINERDLNLSWLDALDLFDLSDREFSDGLRELVDLFIESLFNLEDTIVYDESKQTVKKYNSVFSKKQP